MGVAEPVDLSNAIVWLPSEEARYVTGVSLPVDAGLLQRCTTAVPRSDSRGLGSAGLAEEESHSSTSGRGRERGHSPSEGSTRDLYPGS
jgi:hypothetical protein